LTVFEKYLIYEYILLDFSARSINHVFVNQQVRFALSDRHWGGLKKLTTIGGS
jgi:hypothetical protein